MIIISVIANEATRTAERSCRYTATATIGGKTYTAMSRQGSANELARLLIDSGFADDSVEVRYHGTAGSMSGSLYKLAKYTFSEGRETPLHRIVCRDLTRAAA